MVPKLLRRGVLCALLPVLLGPDRICLAQESDEAAWKTLVMQALTAAGAEDFSKAEQLFQRSLHEAERFGPNDPRMGTTLNSLGLVFKAEKRYADADSAFRRSLAILEKSYGPGSIDAANINFNIAAGLIEQGKQPAALPFLDRSLSVFQQQLGPQSLKSAAVLCMIGDVRRSQKDWAQAETPLRQCAEIREANGGVVNPELAEALFGLAVVYEKQGKSALADPRFKLAEKIREKTDGIMSPALAEVLEAHAAMLKKLGRDSEAEKDAKLAAAIRRNAATNSKKGR